MNRKKWSQPLMWGMIIAILNPLGVSYIALVGVAIGNTLTFVWCAMLAWASISMPFICSVPALTIVGWYKSIY
jgi:hypothetical protein